MTMLDLRLILVLCCSLQLGRLQSAPFRIGGNVCPPEFPHQYGMSICYGVNEEYLTFDEAQASCIAKGAKLAEPRQYYEESYLGDLPFRFKNNNSYWFGITDTVYPGVWTYASDNRPLDRFWRLESSKPPHGNYCIMIKYALWSSTYISTPCEQKAKSVCQYDLPLKVCAIREDGALFPYNASHGLKTVKTPCEYILASIVCGDYDVRVYGTSAPSKNKTTRYFPISARVVVQRAMTNETLVSAQVSRDAIAKSTDGKNLWTVTAGAWSIEVSEVSEPTGQAAVINIGEVGQVDFSARKYKGQDGLYVRCKDLRSSAKFPESLCGFMFGTGDSILTISEFSKGWKESKHQIFMRAVFQQNAGQQLQCSDIARKVLSCPHEFREMGAIRVCAPVFLSEPLNRCVEDDKHWFDICLDAFCGQNVDKCKELKAKVSGCDLRGPYYEIRRVMKPFMDFLDTC